MQRLSSRVRQSAIQALDNWSEGHVYAETLVAKNAERLNLGPGDRGLLNAIVLGVLRHMRLLDFWISLLRPEGRLDISTRNALRVGLVQLLILEVTEHAAVNETVEAAPRKVRGLVNGVLRSALRRKPELLERAGSADLGVRFSHPDWLLKRWQNDFGTEQTHVLLEWNNQPAETFIRANSLKEGSEQVIEAAETTTPVDNSPGFYQLRGPLPKEWIQGGLVYAQDPATRHSVELLAPKAGEKILDACAAPGGKAALIAALAHNQAQLVCTDSNAKRLPRLAENLNRLGVENVQTLTHDWTFAAPPGFQTAFDAILLDVPCSNTGVLRRRVDARWRLTADAITDVAEVQRTILENALPCLKPGGRIVYSTCSIDREENRDLVEAFCGDHDDITLVEDVRIFPHEHGTDGAYATLLQKS